MKLTNLLLSDIDPLELENAMEAARDFWETVNPFINDMDVSLKMTMETLLLTYVYNTYQDWNISMEDKERWLTSFCLRVQENYFSLIGTYLSISQIPVEDLIKSSMNFSDTTNMERVHEGAYQIEVGNWDLENAEGQFNINQENRNKSITRYGNTINTIRGIVNKGLTLKDLAEVYEDLFVFNVKHTRKPRRCMIGCFKLNCDNCEE